MEIKLKLRPETFDKIEKGELNFIKHGYSRNKKYERLFSGLFDEITIICAKTGRCLIKLFKSIEIIEENDKKIFQINFK